MWHNFILILFVLSHALWREGSYYVSSLFALSYWFHSLWILCEWISILYEAVIHSNLFIPLSSYDVLNTLISNIISERSNITLPWLKHFTQLCWYIYTMSLGRKPRIKKSCRFRCPRCQIIGKKSWHEKEGGRRATRCGKQTCGCKVERQEEGGGRWFGWFIVGGA